MDTKPLRMISGLLLCIFTVLHFGCARDMSNYYGKLIGSLHKYGHNIKGNIYAADDTTIFIKGFWYDGTGTDAYFWVGNSSRPSPDGYIVPYPEDYKGRDPPVLKAYNNSDIVLKLPQGKRLRDIKWLSVWCRRFTVNFGGIFIPPDLEVPKPRVLPEFSRMAHGLRSGNISILDSKTLYIPNLHYDGAGPDAYFWVGNGSEPNTFGIKVPNEMGSLEPLRGYQGEDIEIVLPGNLTVYDIDWLAVWCVLYRNNFGHVMIPKDLDIPPALGQTKITPPWWYNPTSSTPTLPTSKHEMSNCKELLEGRLQVQWEQLDEDVRIQILARIGEEQYAAFGLSGQDDKAEMLGADIVVVGYNKKTGKFMADDYYISHVSECDGKKGVCPDERIGGRNDALLLYGERKDGVTSVTYIRPLRTNEPVKDQMIPASEVSVIAAIGPLNARGEAGAHRSSDRISRDMRIDFGSRNVYECSGSLYDIPDTIDVTKPWSPAIIADENTFSARIGPTGGNRRYSRIKGETPWDIAWYINDLLLPEIVVERGETYTFIVEGGDDTSDSSKYHPFYITDDPEGGFGKKDREEQAEERIFAGVAYNENGYPYPTAVGRYCEWVHKTVDMSKDSETFEKFFETLKLECDEGEPAKMTWVVAEDTPDLVYYQCYTLNNLGWKIQVVDAGYKSRDKMNSTEKRMPVLAMMVAPIFAIWIYFR